MEFIEAIKKHREDIYLWNAITNYLAMDPDGRVFGYEKKPIPGCLGWSVEGEINSTDGCGCRFELDTNEIDSAWSVCIITREQYEAALAASKPEWDGEYPIPAGTEVEVHFDGDDSRVWTRFRVEFMAGEIVVLHDYRIDDVDAYKHKTLSFRPIRSKADKQRDLIISKIEKAYKDCPHSDAVPQAIYEAIAEHIRID